MNRWLSVVLLIIFSVFIVRCGDQSAVGTKNNFPSIEVKN